MLNVDKIIENSGFNGVGQKAKQNLKLAIAEAIEAEISEERKKVLIICGMK